MVEKMNTIILSLVLLFITSTKSEQLGSINEELKSANNSNGQISTVSYKFLVVHNSSYLNSSPNKKEVSTHPPLLHYVPTLKTTTTTSDVPLLDEIPAMKTTAITLDAHASTPLLNDVPMVKTDAIIFDAHTSTTVSTVKAAAITSDGHASTPLLHKNPTVKPDAIIFDAHTSTPLLNHVSTMKPAVITSDGHASTPLHHNGPMMKTATITFDAHTSTFPPLIRNRKSTTEEERSTHPSLIHTIKPVKPVLDSAIVFENPTNPQPTNNLNLGVSTQYSDKVKSSTHPPLIHYIPSLKPVTAFLESSTSPPSTFNPNAELPPPNKDGNIIHPILGSPAKPILEVSLNPLDSKNVSVSTPLNDQSIISTKPTTTSKVSTYPPPTRNPNLEIAIHPAHIKPTETIEFLLTTTENIKFSRPTRNPSIDKSTYAPHEISTSATQVTKPTTITFHVNDEKVSVNLPLSDVSTYPPPTRNPNLGIIMHLPNNIKTSTRPTLIQNVVIGNTDKNDSFGKPIATDKLMYGQCPFAIVGCCGAKVSNAACFQYMGCPGPFWDKIPCEKDMINAAVKLVREYYMKGE